jgi:uncharacterized protein (DUF433 family)
MPEPAVKYQHLARKPGSSYHQLFIKGRRISARALYGDYMRSEDPVSVEQIAEDYQLPVEAVREAIEYCQSDPPELRRDIARDEAIMEASGMNEPGYKYNPKPRPLTPAQWDEINRRFPG